MENGSWNGKAAKDAATKLNRIVGVEVGEAYWLESAELALKLAKAKAEDSCDANGGDGVAASREIGPVRGRSPPRAQREAAYCGCDIRTRAQAQGLLVEQHCVVDVHNLKFVDPLLDSFWQGYGDEYHSSLTLIGVGP